MHRICSDKTNTTDLYHRREIDSKVPLYRKLQLWSKSLRTRILLQKRENALFIKIHRIFSIKKIQQTYYIEAKWIRKWLIYRFYNIFHIYF